MFEIMILQRDGWHRQLFKSGDTARTYMSGLRIHPDDFIAAVCYAPDMEEPLDVIIGTAVGK